MWFADVPLAGNGGVAVDRGVAMAMAMGKVSSTGRKQTWCTDVQQSVPAVRAGDNMTWGGRLLVRTFLGVSLFLFFFFRVFAKNKMRRKTRFSAPQRQREIAQDMR